MICNKLLKIKMQISMQQINKLEAHKQVINLIQQNQIFQVKIYQVNKY